MLYNNLIKNRLSVSRVSNNNSCLQHQMIKCEINYSGEEQNNLLDFTLKIFNMLHYFTMSNQKANISE